MYAMWHLYRGRWTHHDQLFELCNTESYCADRRWSSIPTARVARGGSRTLPAGCHWLVLAPCLCWNNLVRVSCGFAAFRSTSHNQYAAVICSSKLWGTCFSMFDDEDLLWAAAVFIVVSYRIKERHPRIFWVCPTRHSRSKCKASDMLKDLRSGHTERGLPQRTAVSVRCGMLHSKQALLTIIFWKHSS